MAVTNTPDKSELLPCPFCGNDASVSDGSNGLHFRVICNKSACRAAGPLERCAVDAKDAWNSRASSRPADQVPDMVERVARALHDHEWSGQPKPEPFTDGCRSYWMSAATAAIAALQAVPVTSGEVGWQPIETIPPASTNLIVWDSDFNRPVVVQTNNDGEPWEGDWDYHITKASHWMLPEPPALKASGEE